MTKPTRTTAALARDIPGPDELAGRYGLTEL
jgi:hypothetical protein